MSVEKEVKDISGKLIEEVKDISGKLIYLEGFLHASKIWGLIVTGLILAWAGYTTLYQIPDVIKKKFDEVIQVTIDKAVSEINSTTSLAQSQASQAEFYVSQVKKTAVELETIVVDARLLLNRLDATEPPESLSDADVPAEDDSQPTLVVADQPLDTIPVVSTIETLDTRITLFDGSWAKTGYYLSIESTLRLHIDRVTSDTVSIRISENNRNNIASKDLDLAESETLEFEENGQRYSVELIRIGRAGYSPLNKAGFFRVTKWVAGVGPD